MLAVAAVDLDEEVEPAGGHEEVADLRKLGKLASHGVDLPGVDRHAHHASRIPVEELGFHDTDDLERSARGIYTGALGFLDFGGRAELNLPIRTFTVTGGRAHFGVGGGVVADSSPAGEYDESLDKARGLVAALKGRGAPVREAVS